MAEFYRKKKKNCQIANQIKLARYMALIPYVK